MAARQPSESELNAYGDMLAASAFGGPALGIGLLGMQIFMVLYGISAFFSLRKKDRRGRLRFVIVSCTILATSSASILLDAWGGYRVLYQGGPTGMSYVQSNLEFWGTSRVPIIIGDAMGWLTIVQGDVLMLWRCYVLWRHKRWLVLLPLSMFFGATVCIVVALLPIASWKGDYMSPDRLKPIIAGISMTVTANVMVTCLIVSRLVMTWNTRRKYFPDQTGPNIYSNVIAIVIESAAPLTLFGICLVITLALAKIQASEDLITIGRATTAADIFSFLYSNGFCALSPQMIIFRVTTGTSWRSAKDTDDGATITNLKPMAFKSGPTESKSIASTYVV